MRFLSAKQNSQPNNPDTAAQEPLGSQTAEKPSGSRAPQKGAGSPRPSDPQTPPDPARPSSRPATPFFRTWLGRVETACLVVFDVAATYGAFWVATWGTAAGEQLFGSPQGWLQGGVLALANVVVFLLFNMYNSLWRYASISEVLRIAAATLVGALVGDAVFSAAFGGVGLRAFVLAWALVLLLCGGVRLALRAAWGNQSWRLARRAAGAAPRTLVVGAGETGSLTIKRMLTGDRDMLGDPVALVDDDPSKRGMHVHGVKVEGTTADIPRLARGLACEQVVVACPSADWEQRQRILALCMQTGLKVQTLPDVRDLPAEGLARVALRDVEISDLLSRDEVLLDLGRMDYVAGRSVLVTGGGGSIGSELVRQLLPAAPSRIVLFDVYENTTYELYHELKGKAAEQGTELVVEIGSITDPEALRLAFDRWDPKVVFHAAAHKHVPLMEGDAREAVRNNVFGTLNVAQMAHDRGCSHFVLVSTDKAVNPTNVMGATKRMCETVVQSFAERGSETVFTAVRFGNVLGSHGSVIPLFKRQLKEGGPITVTHRDITRYFMTIPEASRLVITAGALAKGGEVFVLKMGDPVRIYDLACNLVRLSGLRLGRDIEVKVTGLRPGEKLYEELRMEGEDVIPTDVDDITVSTGSPVPPEVVEENLAALEACLSGTNDEIKRALARAVPTYRPQLEG